MKRLLTFSIVCALAAAGCGSSSSSSSSTSPSSSSTGSSTSGGASAGGGGEKLSLAADPTQLKFDKSALSAKAGKVTITMTNPSSLPHDVSVKGNGASAMGNVVQKGGKSVVSTTLKPGTYEFYCSVDGHEAAGMKGTLKVS